ncbi:MAG: hypothetical protein IKP77_03170 [Acholeplasmatales bacterium]|nr:hypothetical protein [Acholeplasmatales bacterium]
MNKKDLLKDLKNLSDRYDNYSKDYEIMNAYLTILDDDDLNLDFYKSKNKTYYCDQTSRLTSKLLDEELNILRSTTYALFEKKCKEIGKSKKEVEKSKQELLKRSGNGRRLKRRIILSIFLGLITVALVVCAILELCEVIKTKEWFSFGLGVADLIFGLGFSIYEIIEDSNDNIDIETIATGKRPDKEYKKHTILQLFGIGNRITYIENNDKE